MALYIEPSHTSFTAERDQSRSYLAFAMPGMDSDVPAGQGTFRNKYLQPTLVWNTGGAKIKSVVRTLTATDLDYHPGDDTVSSSVKDSFTSLGRSAIFTGSPSTAYEDLCISDELLAELEAEIEVSEAQIPRQPAAAAAVETAAPAAQLDTAVCSTAGLTDAPVAHPAADLQSAAEASTDTGPDSNAGKDRAHAVLLEELSTSKAETAQLAAALAHAASRGQVIFAFDTESRRNGTRGSMADMTCLHQPWRLDSCNHSLTHLLLSSDMLQIK